MHNELAKRKVCEKLPFKIDKFSKNMVFYKINPDMPLSALLYL